MSRAALDALDSVLRGLATSVLAACTALVLIVLALGWIIGLRRLAARTVSRMVVTVADRERARLAIPARGLADVALDVGGRNRDLQRELVWVFVHGSFGLFVGLVGLTVPLGVLQHITYPVWSFLAPDADTPTIVFWPVESPAAVAGVTALALVWLIVFLIAEPWIARVQSFPGRALLESASRTQLTERIARLTETRAAALDAHTLELRRIERALHDGTQNRLVAANMLIGTARRAAPDDPQLLSLLDRAQDATEAALAELRSTVRGMLPPILADRGLDGALSSLAATMPIPCEVRSDTRARLPTSTEAAIYFTVAEALTNAVRHAAATRVRVTRSTDHDTTSLRIEDDGHGGAVEHEGSGLAGIRKRIEALDGSLTINSPAGGPTLISAVIPCGS